jgi:NTE family protein
MPPRQVSIVFSGGIALGAYQAGAYAALHEHGALQPEHLAGSSIGAITSALVAGNPPELRIERLRAFWNAITAEPAPFRTPCLDPSAEGPWRHAHNWLSVLQTRLFGRPGAFQPRVPELTLRDVTSVYDLAPLRATLERFIDFDLLNAGRPRVSVTMVDIETGEAVVFDTGRGDRIGPDHLVATCGFLPDFPPLEIGGRLLGDGGLIANAPIESILLDPGREGDLLCFVVDLFSPDGGRPRTLEEAAARRWDLLFGNQSRQRLKDLEFAFRLRSGLARLARELGPKARQDPDIAAILDEASEGNALVVYLSYRAPEHEAGPEKAFDFSQATLADRWAAGSRDMAEAVRLAADRRQHSVGLTVRMVRR